jgi:6-phosphofructokinase
LNGVDGLLAGNCTPITEEAYAPYRNLGGYDYLGNGPDGIKTIEEKN